MGGKILVIDDGREIRDFLANRVLASRGYTVLVAEDGENGLNLARQALPDLIIVDQNMPGRTGLQVLTALRDEGRDTPVILITGEGSEMLAKEAIGAGAAAYLTKPFETDQLLAAIDRALREINHQRETARMATELKQANETLTQRLREQETLTSIGQALTSELDVDAVLHKVIEAAVDLTGAEEGSLLLLDEQTGELTMRAAKNFDDQFVRTFRVRTDDSLAGYVVRSGEPYLLDESAPQKIKTTYLVHSLLYVPLRQRGRVSGVLGVDNRRKRRVFSKHEQQLLMTLADYAAIAVENAQLYSTSVAERNKLDAILRETEDGVIVIDPEQLVVLMNPSARAAFGINGAEVVGRPLGDVLQNAEARQLFAAAPALPAKRGRRAEVALDDGRIFNAHLTDIEGVGQAVVMQDITHLKELDRLKSDFVATVSHDLRSPLTAILGYVELIGRAGPVTEQQADFIKRVRSSVQAITTLISDLLDLGRIEAGFDSQKEAVEFSALVRGAVDGLTGRATEKRIRMVFDLPPATPPVLGNPIRLRQMVANLVDNAIKYTPEGGVVQVRVQEEGEQLIFTVIDTGVGIGPADQPYVFDKFYRSANVRETGIQGTGLGLSIVKGIAEDHGGRVWVESKLGHGTMFVVVLPKQKS
jgi:two-component system, OmpR family, phosphate regulon sensor histidine kinase PhoR